MTDAFRLSGVFAGYGGGDVIRGLDLSVARGELLGVLGPNGCGKTTLLRLATGTLRPRTGRVELFGADVAAMSPRDVARRVAFVPQETAPVFAMTALEVVLLGRHPWHPAFAFESEADIELARRSLAEVAAAEFEAREFGTLSGGERQRVLFARGLCQGGDALLCDEPTAHLDLRHQAAVFRLLRDLARGGRAVVCVTHDVQLAAQACDRIALLGPSGLVAAGEPAAVLTRDHLALAFDIDTDVHADASGRPLVVRQLGLPERPR